jgi:hypothetical protein
MTGCFMLRGRGKVENRYIGSPCQLSHIPNVLPSQLRKPNNTTSKVRSPGIRMKLLGVAVVLTTGFFSTISARKLELYHSVYFVVR